MARNTFRSYDRKRGGFTIAEMAGACLIVALLVLSLIPVLARFRPYHNRRSYYYSPSKIITLAFLSYIQDYDEHFPPGVGSAYPLRKGVPDKSVGRHAQSWGPSRKIGDDLDLSGLLTPYVRDEKVFAVMQGDDHPVRVNGMIPLRFMYNDLLTTESYEAVVAKQATVLMLDADPKWANVGHAWIRDHEPYDSRFNAQGRCAGGEGASVQHSPLYRSRGANFAFTDGHVKWFRNDGPNPPIFFPPRESASRSHLDANGIPMGPDPMEMQGKGTRYAGTFHLR